MLTISIPDEINDQLSSLTEDKEKFIITAIRQKIASKRKSVTKVQLAKEYEDSSEENVQILKDFINADTENWQDY